MWIIRPHLCHERRRKSLFLCLGDDGTLVLCSFLKASAEDCSGWWLLVVQSRREMACRWSGVASTLSSTVGLGGMAQWRLGVRCAEMDSRRRVTLPGVVVASAAARPGKVDAAVQL